MKILYINALDKRYGLTKGRFSEMNIRALWRVVDKYILIPTLRILSLFKATKKLGMQSPQKILLLKLAALGDTILMVPIIRAMRNKFPRAKIVMIATKINAGTVERCPYLDEVILLDLAGIVKQPLSFLKFIQQLRKEKFDIVFDFEQRIRLSALFSYLTYAKRSFGFRTKGYFRHYLYSDVVPHRKDKHEFDCYRDLVQGVLGEITDTKLEFWSEDKDNDWVKDFLKGVLGKKKIVVIHPGCGGDLNKGGRAKEWPKEYYVELINVLASDNLQFLISGGTNEVSLAREIADKVQKQPIILAGKTTISQLAAILRLSNLLISGDTGIMHLAAALNINTIALFGSTDSKKWRSLSEKVTIINANLDCSPCQYFGIDDPICSDYKCMRTISPNEVVKAVSKILYS